MDMVLKVIVNCCIMDLQSESIIPLFVTTMTIIFIASNISLITFSFGFIS